MNLQGFTVKIFLDAEIWTFDCLRKKCNPEILDAYENEVNAER